MPQVQLPPEPPDYYDETVRNTPPLSLHPPENCREVMAPWLWPLAMATCYWQLVGNWWRPPGAGRKR